MNHLHTGYYLYNDKMYFTRTDAFDDMILNNDCAGTLRFYYNDHVFTQLNWEIEPNIDISILYKIRAQQIRDKYKYLVLCYSGGHDSTEILWTFLNNKIFFLR